MEIIQYLVKQIKNEKNIEKSIDLNKRLRFIINNNLKSIIKNNIIRSLANGYKLENLEQKENVFFATYKKGFICKKFICFSDNYYINILKVVNVKKRYTYSINGQSGINTKQYLKIEK